MLGFLNNRGSLSTESDNAHYNHLSSLRESPLFWRLIDIAKSTASATSLNGMMESILIEAQAIAKADGGTVYIMEGQGIERALRFAITKNNSLNLETAADDITSQTVPLFNASGPNLKNIASYCALNNQVMNVRDAYQESNFDFSDTKHFDLTIGYRTQSVLTVPLRDSEETVIGVLQLVNAKDCRCEITEFSLEVQDIVQAMSTLVSLSLSNYLLADRQYALLVSFSRCENVKQLFECILSEAQHVTHAEGGTLYIKKYDEYNETPVLEFSMFFNTPLGIFKGGEGQYPVELPAVSLFKEGKPNLSHVVTHAVHMKKMVNIENAYANKEFNFEGTMKFDQANGYRSQSFLTVPLLNHQDDVIAVLQLLNARDPETGDLCAFTFQHETVINALAKHAAITLNNENLLQEYQALLRLKS